MLVQVQEGDRYGRNAGVFAGMGTRNGPIPAGGKGFDVGNSVFSNKFTIFECFRKYALNSYDIRPAGVLDRKSGRGESFLA